ncbi:hypothetical protein FRACYDRAFT_251292 [Fragilariopsis cylindrus CCMP1102]|uniref:Uncharacterized protein n=1 Tax=Fragilariopsis cylindrus CCMP1102 TaxID=635003 RepID=A0A1E7ENY6_9STRA|nr:hypothetical protein FRACYDRAFT_251292 [Fragilariopsis cylindrus CCMP1102]|eukprot:OEU07243.1 hypothetical protein FRACYDRAFT_251292 [Fragilariopsis cylindrus CCMP1102]
MATNRRKYKKTGRGSGGNNNPAKKPQVVLVPDPAVSAANDESDNAAAVAAGGAATASIDDELPSTDQLSRELCTIVDVVHDSRDESLHTLDNLYTWSFTEDADFLKSFHICGGIVKVLDFLKASMNDIHCKGSIRMRCIKNAADVISTVTHTGENNENKDIAAKNATTLLDCDGIDTLIAASEEYSGGGDIPQLEAVCSVWNAFKNLTCILRTDLVMIQDTALSLSDTGIDIMSQLKSVDGDIASEILGNVFLSLNNIVLKNYITKRYFQDKEVLSKCLDIFKKNGTWNFRIREELRMHEAAHFFNTCRKKNLLDESLDNGMILPLLVVALKQFPSNDKIRRHALYFIDKACSSEANNKKIILKLGVMEPLGSLLASDEINDEDEKNKVRTLISKIIA